MAEQQRAEQRAHNQRLDAAVQSLLAAQQSAIKHTAAQARAERRKGRLEIANTVGIYLAAVVAVGAIVAAWISSSEQLHNMQGQLDVMVAQQRPWLQVTPRLDGPLRTILTLGQKPEVFSASLAFDAKNTGLTPATKIVFSSTVVVEPEGTDMKKRDEAQEQACKQANEQANGSGKVRESLFPNEAKILHTGFSGRIAEGESFPYVLEGCVDYTYAGNQHGQTGYRMTLGRIDTLWRGFKFDWNEEQPIGNGMVLLSMKTDTLQFRLTDDGGNWAR
jgi:hypothetical protein